MTQDTDSGNQVSGVQGAPSPVTSQPGGVQPDSGLQDLDGLVAQLADHPAFQTLLERQAQATKDRRFVKIERQVKGFADQLAEYQTLTGKEGLSHDAAMRLINMGEQLDRLNEQLGGGTPANVPATGNQKSVPNVDFAGLLENMGLDANDSEVNAIIVGQGDYVQKVNAFSELAKQKRQAAQTQTGAAPTTPQPQTIMPSGQGKAPKKPEPDLEAQYKQEIENARQGDVEAISRIKKKYREKGLQIW